MLVSCLLIGQDAEGADSEIPARGLYRALLRYAHRALPASEDRGNDRRKGKLVLRRTFDNARGLSSVVLIRQAFERGHDTLRLLHAASLTPPASEARSTLTDTLALIPDPPKRARRIRHVRRAKASLQPDGTPRDTDSRGSCSVLQDRPRPIGAFGYGRAVEGGGELGAKKRKVPSYVLANGFPILRVKKPQPYQLSNALGYRIEQRQRWSSFLDEYEGRSTCGVWEDEWDEILQNADSGPEKDGRADGREVEAEQRQYGCQPPHPQAKKIVQPWGQRRMLDERSWTWAWQYWRKTIEIRLKSQQVIANKRAHELARLVLEEKRLAREEMAGTKGKQAWEAPAESEKGVISDGLA